MEHDSSPLKRIVAAASALGDDDLLLKVDALHLVFDVALSKDMLRQAREERLDCVKPADDFPAQLSSEVYRYGALKEIAARIDGIKAGTICIDGDPRGSNTFLVARKRAV